MYRIGIIGSYEQVGDLAGIITSIDGCSFTGSFHTKPDPSRYLGDSGNSTVYTSFPAFQSSCDAMIVEDTGLIDPGQVAGALKSAIPVLLAKPLQWEASELEYLIKIAEEANTLFKLRNTFAYQPIIRTANNYIKQPAFIDYQIDISSETPSDLLLEQIIQSIYNCLDAIFQINPAGLKKINTVLSPDLFGMPGVIHGRLEFDNACVANITLNGYAEQDKSTCAIYQENRHVVMNFMSQRLMVKDKLPEQEKLKSTSVSFENVNPILSEITHFFTMASFPDQTPAQSDLSLQSFQLASKMIRSLPLEVETV